MVKIFTNVEDMFMESENNGKDSMNFDSQSSNGDIRNNPTKKDTKSKENFKNIT